MEYIVCCFLSLTAEAAILWQYASVLFVPKRPLYVRLPALCALYLILLAAAIPGSTGLNLLSYFIVNSVFLLTQYCLKWHLAFFHTAVLTAVMALCELTVYSLIEHSVPHFFTEAANFHYMIALGIFSKLLFFTVVYVLMHIFKGHREYNEQRDPSVWLLMFVPVASVVIMHVLVIILGTYTLPTPLLWMITVSSVLMLIMNLLTFAINQYNQQKNMEYTGMQLVLQKEANAAEYYRMLNTQSENQNIIIHDIKQHLQSIKTLNEKGEHEKIKGYISHLLSFSDLEEDVRLCSHELLNAILCRYRRDCANQGIGFHADIRSTAIDFISDNDLTTLFCNLLDNALESASRMAHGFIEIRVVPNDLAGITAINVINSCRVTPFQGSGETLITQKSDGRRHGLGIKSIQKTVKKYQGNMKMYYDDNTLTFHTIITLRNTGDSEAES